MPNSILAGFAINGTSETRHFLSRVTQNLVDAGRSGLNLVSSLERLRDSCERG